MTPDRALFTAALVLRAAAAFGAAPVVGDVPFPNSGAPAAQADFLYGMAQLHNFEYDDAAEAFARAEKVDPGFAMAFWGEAMTKNHAIWMEQDRDAARAILNRLAATPAARAAKAPTEREKAYLDAVETLYGDGDKDVRDTRYAEAMRHVTESFPEDPDAAAFYALALMGTAHEGRDIPTYMKAAGILEPLFYGHPNHPGFAHYLIHACDDPIHASLALPAARAYSKIAPDAGHAQHMCSHIFLALGMWSDVVAANVNAIAVVNRKRASAGKPPAGCGHYPLWLEYGYLEQARVRDADQVLAGCESEVARAETAAAHADHADPDHSSVGSLAEMWARRALDGGGAIPPEAPAGVDFSKRPHAWLTVEFVRALASARRGDVAAARQATARFEEARDAVTKALLATPDAMESKRVEILRLELQGATRRAEGAGDDAVRLLRQAAAIEEGLPFAFGPPYVEKPSHELLGEILLELKRPAEAVTAFEAALTRAPRRTAALLGLARAASQAGDSKKSLESVRALRAIWDHADRSPEELQKD